MSVRVEREGRLGVGDGAEATTEPTTKSRGADIGRGVGGREFGASLGGEAIDWVGLGEQRGGGGGREEGCGSFLGGTCARKCTKHRFWGVIDRRRGAWIAVVFVQFLKVGGGWLGWDWYELVDEVGRFVGVGLAKDGWSDKRVIKVGFSRLASEGDMIVSGC